MSISSSALASLVIAGTAIGGSTFAVMANTASSDINSSNISQITDTDPSAKVPGESVATVDENGNPLPLTPVNPSQTPAPTPTPIAPTLPPLDFGGNGDDDDDEDGEYEDGNDDSDEESYEDDDVDEGDYGHNGYHGDDEDEDEEEDD